MGDLVPVPSGLGRLTSQKFVYGPDNHVSCAIHYHHQDGRLRLTGQSRLTRRRDGAYDFCLRLRSSATRSTRPTPSRRPRWGTDGHVSAGLPEESEYHSATYAPPLCAVCGGRAF